VARWCWAELQFVVLERRAGLLALDAWGVCHEPTLRRAARAEQVLGG
jgi:hypothetical protein